MISQPYSLLLRHIEIALKFLLSVFHDRLILCQGIVEVARIPEELSSHLFELAREFVV